MSAEQTEQRRWAVTVSYTEEETYYVDADDEDEAEDKALDECGGDDAEVVRTKQIAGPKPVPPPPPVPLTGVLTLLDGRVLTLPCADERGWFRLSGGQGDWWSNGHVAVRASGVTGRVENSGNPYDISRILPRDHGVGQPPEVGAEFTRDLGGGVKKYVEFVAEGIKTTIDAIYLPLVHDPASGLETRIVTPEQPVYGVRGGEIVAAVMPVRQ